MNHVLIAQVAADDPVRQQAWFVHKGRCCYDSYCLTARLLC